MTTNTVPSTTTDEAWDSNVPRYLVGEHVDPRRTGRDGTVTRTTTTPGGSQTIWLEECPSWCIGHNPDEQVEKIEDYDWAEHAGPSFDLPLAGLSSHTGVSYREPASASFEVSQVRPVGRVGWQLPLLSIETTRAAGLTTSEARSFAAALLRVADMLEVRD